MKAPLNLSNLSLRKRLILIFMTILLWLAAINCVLIYLFVGYVQQYNDMIETITLTNSINGILKHKLDEEIRDIAYGKVPFENGTQYEHLNNMYQNFYKIKQGDTTGEFRTEIEEVRQTLDTTTEYIDKLGEQIQGNVSADERNITYEYITILTDLIDEKVQILLQSTLVVKEQSRNMIAVSLKRDITIYVFSFIGVILTSLLFAWYVSGSFVKPIRILGQKTNEIAEGNLTIGEIPIPSKNEIGDLCRSYNRMFHNLKDIILSVRNTNDLVVLTSKDIHQSILENRLAGEEVAEATQTISVNLHKQDELIKKTVSTFENLFSKYNEVFIKTNNVNIHSNESLQITKEVNNQINNIINQFERTNKTAQRLNVETESFEKLSEEMYEHFRLMTLIAREINIVSLTVINEMPENITNKTLDKALHRFKELSDESNKISQKFEDKIIHVLDLVPSIRKDIKQNLEYTRYSKIQMGQIKSHFLTILSNRNKQQIEIEGLKEEMQEAFEQMLSVRKIILDIEHSSQISKIEVVGIAAMGEEQLTTLEEVSDASFKLVERIQEMKDNIRQFKT